MAIAESLGQLTDIEYLDVSDNTFSEDAGLLLAEAIAKQVSIYDDSLHMFTLDSHV